VIAGRAEAYAPPAAGLAEIFDPGPATLLNSNLSFAAINCNSLNTSTLKSANMKIASILKLNADVIFLSDVRLGSRAAAVQASTKSRYQMLYNSTNTKRGVALLIKNGLGLDIDETMNDAEENILLIKCTINNNSFVLGSVYGPNEDNETFFINLARFLERCQGSNIVLAGDWNTTVSGRNVENNADVHNMRSIPSATRTLWLNDLMARFNMIDIFRHRNGDVRDYTYVPFGSVRKNRSRIDYFLVSDSLIGHVSDCSIMQHNLGKMFDHRPIFLALGTVKKKGRTVLNNRILNHPLLFRTCKLAAYEAILNHISITGAISEHMFLNTCTELERADVILHRLLDFCSTWDWNTLTPDLLQEKRNLELELDNILTNITPYDDLCNRDKEIDNDIWFEELIGNITKRALGLQAESLRRESKIKKDLFRELLDLKKVRTPDDNRITEIEGLLSQISDNEIADKLCNYMKDDICNNEKMTPVFLSAAKAMIRDNLTVIRDDDGNEFNTVRDRRDYIRSFYADLYKKPDYAPNTYNGCIEQFLGPDILNSPTVRGSMLTEQEKNSIDGPITLGELDNALKKANKKSAPGIDGSSNKFIEKIWPLIRVPLVRYAECVFEKGRLTASFNTACIRLIPKKGDARLLKNWRPISLLSCYYKLLSRVINERLGKVIDKITGRSQKAYTTEKYLQEVIINICNNIEECNKTGKPGMLISIDQKKAFDSVYHEFCNEAFKFFGFGENLIHMMNTLSTNRNARIFMEDGSLSEPLFFRKFIMIRKKQIILRTTATLSVYKQRARLTRSAKLQRILE